MKTEGNYLLAMIVSSRFLKGYPPPQKGTFWIINFTIYKVFLFIILMIYQCQEPKAQSTHSVTNSGCLSSHVVLNLVNIVNDLNIFHFWNELISVINILKPDQRL